MQLDTIENVSVIEQLQTGFTSHTRTHAEHLAKDYIVKNPSEVGDFIGENFFLLDILEEIPNRISQYFGDNQKLTLTVSYEPEFPNSSELWVEVLTELSAKEARPILDKFDEEWWLDNMDRGNFKLNITLKFI